MQHNTDLINNYNHICSRRLATITFVDTCAQNSINSFISAPNSNRCMQLMRFIKFVFVSRTSGETSTKGTKK